MSGTVDEDPERVRVNALVQRALEGRLTEDEREELVLHAEHEPQILARMNEAEQQGRLAQGWLARVEADVAIESVERGSRARIERGLGLALLAGGYPLVLFSPLLGIAALGAGFFVLVYSFARVRLSTHSKDPYKDVVR